jgi:RHS repeat-associated protein
MRVRDSQLDALAASTMDRARRERLLELRQQGFDVSEDSANGAFVIRDAAGCSAQVVSRGLRSRIISAEGRTVELEQHASSGRISRIVDPSGREVRFERDADGFLESIDRGPGGGKLGCKLSESWQPLRTDYPDGTTSLAEYSPAGQPTRLVQRDGSEIHYEYDADGRLAALVDPQGHRTKLSNPGPGVSRTIEYPNGDRHTYLDHPDAHLLRFDINGETHAQYQYAPASKSLEVSYPDGGSEHFVFGKGGLVETANEHATVKFQYDDAGRLLSEDTDGRVVQYLRNEVGALIGIVTPDGDTISYARDRDQRLTGITDWNGDRYEIALPPSGPPSEIRYPNGLVIAMEANAMGLPASWSVRRSSAQETPVDAASWEHDTCDRLVASTRDRNRREYKYNQVSRLIEVRCSDPVLSERFELDPSGNRVQSGNEPCTYDQTNRLLRQGSREFAYDGLGNLSSERGGPNSSTYSYNGRGQLTGIQTDGSSAEYAYDTLGRRIRKRVGNVTTHFQWAGTQLLSETTDDGRRVVQRDYLVCPEFLSPLAFREGSSAYYIHLGRLQEPLCVTDRRCEIVWKAEYLTFGRALISVDRVRQPLRLPGQYHDEETGLHYSVARYYAPDLGRFLSIDPHRTPGASLNFYTYCDGDPVNRVDPTGEIGLTLTAVLTAVAVGVVVGAVVGAGYEIYKQKEEHPKDDINWGQVGYAALIGGCLGGIGGAVFAVAAAGATAGLVYLGMAAIGTAAGVGTAALAGAAAGGLSGAVTYCVQALGTGHADWAGFGLALGAGAAIGAVTMGVGGIFAARAAAAARAAEQAAAARAAEEAADRAAQEAADRAAQEAADRAAAEAARLARRDALAQDPAHNGQISPKTLREADVGLDLESQGKLKGPITRDPNPAGGEFIDADGVKWDVKRFNSKFPPKKGGFDAARDMGKIEGEIGKGENVIVDTADMSPADVQTLKNAVNAKGLSDKVIFYP